VEVTIGLAITGFTAVSLYMGIAQGFKVTQLARENLRATQLLEEKMETIRLYTWEQINASGFIPETFTESFYPAETESEGGTSYDGTVTISDPSGMTESYAGSLKQVDVTLTWISAGVARSRSMRSFISSNGLQKYIY